MNKIFVQLTIFLLSLIVFFARPHDAFAVSNLNIICNTVSCSVIPGTGSFFSGFNLVPGQSFTRILAVRNNTSQQGSFAVEAFNLQQSTASATLADKVVVVIRRNNVNGPVVYGSTPKTLQDLINDGFVPLGSFLANQTDNFYFSAALKEEADNQYQNATSIFDMDLGFEFTSISPSSPSSAAGGGGGGGSSNTARTAECSDTAPTTAPLLSFIESSTSDGQVTLLWNAVAGADHYAINFGTQSGVFLYGNNNIGNQTSYTVTNLSPGFNYFFQVIPINGCAPGPRSNIVSTGGTALGIGATVNAPGGFSQDQILGVETEASGEAKNNEQAPSVLGSTEECVSWKQYLPLIFLAIQILVSSVIYLIVRDPENKVKQIAVVVTVIVTAVMFYFLRNCNCAQFSLFALLCKWYFVIAILAAFITQFINYALIERETTTEKKTEKLTEKKLEIKK